MISASTNASAPKPRVTWRSRREGFPRYSANEEGSLPITTAVTTPHRILIVDDNGDAADSLARLLQMDGYEVLTAYDGAEGLEMAARTRVGTAPFGT